MPVSDKQLYEKYPGLADFFVEIGRRLRSTEHRAAEPGASVTALLDAVENRLIDASAQLCAAWHDVQKLRRLEAEIESDMVKTIQKAIKRNDWRAAMCYLERRYPERWAPQSSVVVELEPLRKPTGKVEKRPRARASTGGETKRRTTGRS